MSESFWQGEKKEDDVSESGKLKSSDSRNRFQKTLLMLIGPILLVILGGALTFYAVRANPSWLQKPVTSNQNRQTDSEVNALIQEVSKIIELPSQETPTLATVTELDKVKDQDFFRRAQNGDKVLIYREAKKAYLYRPGEKKIIEVGVVNVNQKGDSSSEQSQTLVPEEALTPTTKLSTPNPTQITTSPTPTR